MSKKIGILFVAIGVVLVISALLLFVYNMKEDEAAGESAEGFLVDVKSEIMNSLESVDESKISDASDEAPESTDQVKITDMPIINIKGYDFIGYVSISDLNVELPVINDWDYAKLNIAPCRQAGSIENDDLIIAAHNYTSHFANLDSVGIGGEVLFTNMNGDTIEYRVTDIKILDGTAVEDVINSGHDLVLYTCTYEGTTRIVLFCDRTD